MPDLVVGYPDIVDALRRRHIKRKAQDGYEGGVFLEEVTHNGSGGSRCDALFVGFTSTTGRQLTGYEIKCSRSDWLRELAQPGKADAWADNCHTWWLVCADDTICELDELPDRWGLLTPKGMRAGKLQLKVVRPAAEPHRDFAPSWSTCVSVIARADSTIRSRWWEQVNRIRAEEQKKAEQAVLARSPEARLQENLAEANRKLRIMQTALGASDYDDMTRFAPLLERFARHGYDVERTVQDLTSGYSTNTIRRELERLEKAISALNGHESGAVGALEVPSYGT